MAAISVSFTRTLLLLGTKFQYSRIRRQVDEGKQSDEGVHLLSYNAQRPPKETEALDACIGA